MSKKRLFSFFIQLYNHKNTTDFFTILDVDCKSISLQGTVFLKYF